MERKRKDGINTQHNKQGSTDINLDAESRVISESSQAVQHGQVPRGTQVFPAGSSSFLTIQMLYISTYCINKDATHLAMTTKPILTQQSGLQWSFTRCGCLNFKAMCISGFITIQCFRNKSKAGPFNTMSLIFEMCII